MGPNLQVPMSIMVKKKNPRYYDAQQRCLTNKFTRFWNMTCNGMGPKIAAGAYSVPKNVV